MDALAINIIVSFMLLSYGGQSTSQDVQQMKTTTTSSNVPSENGIASATVRCATAHGRAGSCVDRRGCDYGTNAIDFTLFVPKGYKKSCPENEVCCPFSYQLERTTRLDSEWSEEISVTFKNK